MKPPRGPEFLARESYRIRRLMDAARFLPALGLVLLLLPLMRAAPEGEAASIATETVYLFAVWIGLIAAAFLMSLGLRRTLDRPPDARPPAPRAASAPPPDEG